MGAHDVPATFVALSGAITAADVASRVHGLIQRCEDAPGAMVVCDVSGLTHEDLATVDTLARLQLWAERAGRELRIRHASENLRRLIVLVGLSGVLCVEPLLAVELKREAEEGEESRGIEEEGDAGDGAV